LDISANNKLSTERRKGMSDKKSNCQCPCPDTRKLSKEERLNALIETQCLQYEALSGEYNNLFKDK
jgi:hypothetical protein